MFVADVGKPRANLQNLLWITSISSALEGNQTSHAYSAIGLTSVSKRWDNIRGEGYFRRAADLMSENNALLTCAARVRMAGLSEPLADISKPKYLYSLVTWISTPLRKMCTGFIDLPGLVKGIILVLMRLMFKSHVAQYSLSRSTASCKSWVDSDRRTRSSANNNNRSLE